MSMPDTVMFLEIGVSPMSILSVEVLPACWAQKSEDFTGLDFEVEVVDRGAVAIVFRDVIKAYHGRTLPKRSLRQIPRRLRRTLARGLLRCAVLANVSSGVSMSEGFDAMRLVERAFGGEVLVLAPTVFGDERVLLRSLPRRSIRCARPAGAVGSGQPLRLGSRGAARGPRQWDAPQGKLVRRRPQGALDVVVDLRHDSPRLWHLESF